MLMPLSGINGVVVYQDDLIIMTTDNDNYNLILDQVLSTLKEAGIKLNQQK